VRPSRSNGRQGGERDIRRMREQKSKGERMKEREEERKEGNKKWKLGCKKKRKLTRPIGIIGKKLGREINI
jgi:hypothetical protein